MPHIRKYSLNKGIEIDDAHWFEDFQCMYIGLAQRRCSSKSSHLENFGFCAH